MGEGQVGLAPPTQGHRSWQAGREGPGEQQAQQAWCCDLPGSLLGSLRPRPPFLSLVSALPSEINSRHQGNT